MTNNKVASYAERIERVMNEIDDLKGSIKDIYTEVKAADLKPKALRKAIANKRRKVDAQFEQQVEEYASLLLALPGATYRGVAEQTGISKSKLQRRVPRKANGTSEPPHDPETGEIREPRSPATLPSAEQPPSNAAVVPTREDGRAGERDPIQTMSRDEIWDRVGESPALAHRRAVSA